jgi:putative nucleotidyltransferase with HDIG domain
MSRKRLYEQHLRTLAEISHALGEKDGYTQAHGHRVALYAMRLARRLGFSREDIRNVGIGGLFHDVGKLALSDRIFTNRETRLPSDLRQEVRCHPLIGAALLKNIEFLKPAVDFVLFHHEREDGNGYPFGLKAGEIPPGAKIISIADCFDAVTTDRPYQKGQSVASAYEILREGCRRYFCEAYVETFIEEIEENGIIPDTGPDPLLADNLVRSAAGCSAR